MRMHVVSLGYLHKLKRENYRLAHAVGGHSGFMYCNDGGECGDE